MTYATTPFSLSVLGWATLVVAGPGTYRVDPSHTHPMFEVDHFSGLSTWRGLFKTTSGTITLDRERDTGTVDVVVDVASVDLAHDKLNATVVLERIGDWNGLDVGHYPTAEYHGILEGLCWERRPR